MIDVALSCAVNVSGVARLCTHEAVQDINVCDVR